MSRFDITQAFQQAVRTAVPAERTIETITGDILEAQRKGGEAILTIGNCLIEAKSMLPHGEWLPWLNSKVGYSAKTAQNFMRLPREISNPQALADLGATKALALLALPTEERERFLENHNVIDMTTRQLEQAIKERDEAWKAAEQARADASAAEQARVKIAEDMRLANGRVAQLSKELEELRSRPVEVAVQHAEEEDLEQARREAAEEAHARVEALEKELEEARKQQMNLLNQHQEMGEKLKEVRRERKDAMDAQKAAREKLDEAKRELERVKKALQAAGDKEVTQYGVYFEACQEDFARMMGLLHKLKTAGDTERRSKLATAAEALLDTMGKQLAPFREGGGGHAD